MRARRVSEQTSSQPGPRRARGRRVGIVIASLGAAAAAVLAFRAGSTSFASLRQTAVEHIPGTLSYALAPPPSGFEPRLGPRRAAARAPGVEPAEASLTLATVRDRVTGRRIGPAWVVFARGVCMRSAKGELVADARGNDPNGLRCTDRWMLVVAVHAETGDVLLTESAYDPSGTWEPAAG